MNESASKLASFYNNVFPAHISSAPIKPTYQGWIFLNSHTDRLLYKLVIGGGYKLVIRGGDKLAKYNCNVRMR